MPSYQVPEGFALETIRREGEAGGQWIGSLPVAIASLLERWHLTLDGESRHGYLALVVPVRRRHEPLMLKVSWMDRWSATESLALRTWAGHGAVELIDEAPERGALLLERADPDRSLALAPIDTATEIAGRLLRRLAVPAPPAARTFEEELGELQADLESGWQRVGQPFSRRLLDRACGILAEPRRPVDPVLVNVDLHYENVLQATREPWLVIDPKVVAGELEYGVAQLLWSRFDELGGLQGFHRRLATLVEAADLDSHWVQRWALVRILEYWVWSVGLGFTEDPDRCSRLVEWLLAEDRM